MSCRNTDDESRRRFLKLTAAAAAVAITGGLATRVRAGELPHVAATDPTAQMLGYVEDAGKTGNSLYKAGSACANCQLYLGTAEGYGPCQLFPGKSVNAKGWCSSYTAKKS